MSLQSSRTPPDEPGPSTLPFAAGVAQCDACDAVCCRLTVVVQPEDGIAEHLTVEQDGLRVMARDGEGWCVAVDSARMCCSIYEARPSVCRRFRMGGAHCEAVREDYLRDGHAAINMVLLDGHA